MKKRIIIQLLAILSIASMYAQDASFYQRIAEKGDKEAMYHLANCYLHGNGGVSQDFNLGTTWMTKAAKKSYAPAQADLALCYIYGIGVLKDYQQAWKLVVKAMEQNYPPAFNTAAMCAKEGFFLKPSGELWLNYIQHGATLGDDDSQAELGHAYLFGDESVGLSQDIDKGVAWLEKAAEQNNEDACYDLGLCYEQGAGVKKDSSTALKYFYTAAQSGKAEALCKIGRALLYGTDDLKPDYKEAMTYINAAVEKENAEAYFLMGEIYYYGAGVEENNETAAEWYKKAVENRYGDAYGKLAHMYIYGIGVAENKEKGFSLYQSMANVDMVMGYVGLGVCYENGFGVSENIQQAVSYYTKAADQDNMYSAHRLYHIYRDGVDGVGKNAELALQYLRQAADSEYNPALYSLGFEFFAGEILHEEKDTALKYIKKAADNGYEFAAAVLGSLYYSGEYLVNKNYDEAFKYLSIAVNDPSGINDGLLGEVYRDLGACYRFGRGTEADQSLASYFTEMAAKYGDEKSKNGVGLLRNR